MGGCTAPVTSRSGVVAGKWTVTLSGRWDNWAVAVPVRKRQIPHPQKGLEFVAEPLRAVAAQLDVLETSSRRGPPLRQQEAFRSAQSCWSGFVALASPGLLLGRDERLGPAVHGTLRSRVGKPLHALGYEGQAPPGRHHGERDEGDAGTIEKDFRNATSSSLNSSRSSKPVGWVSWRRLSS